MEESKVNTGSYRSKRHLSVGWKSVRKTVTIRYSKNLEEWLVYQLLPILLISFPSVTYLLSQYFLSLIPILILNGNVVLLMTNGNLKFYLFILTSLKISWEEMSIYVQFTPLFFHKIAIFHKIVYVYGLFIQEDVWFWKRIQKHLKDRWDIQSFL